MKIEKRGIGIFGKGAVDQERKPLFPGDETFFAGRKRPYDALWHSYLVGHWHPEFSVKPATVHCTGRTVKKMGRAVMVSAQCPL